MLDKVKGKHPRLLFTAEEIPAIRKLAKTEGSGKWFFEQLENYVAVSKNPGHTKFLNDATDGQRQGLWRLPTIALHYVITEKESSFIQARDFLKFIIELENWELGQEQDLGMSSANIMIGAALAYDMLYNDLEPTFREQCRKKLLLMARRQYYRGHMGLAKSTQYWQGDPANNHRWHRNAGMVLATLAAADDVDGKNDYQWILEKSKADMDYVNKWLPEDGTSHESPSYLVFGLTHLCLFTDAADRCLGTEYQKHPAFKHFPYFRKHTMTPGNNKSFAYGDSGEAAIGGYNHAFYFCARAHQDKKSQAFIESFMKQHPKSFDFCWMGLVWFDASLSGPATEDPEKEYFFGDVGVSLMRDGWQEKDVGMMLKCGPYGGYGLNTFRNERNFKYVNIAHDDPDANEVIIYAKGNVFVKPDGYSERKKTEDHNTLIVNQKGQVASKSDMWTQPPKGMDLTKLSYTTTYKKNALGMVICEGEAGNAYDDIKTFRRSVLWLPGNYIAIVDNISADKKNDLRIHYQGIKVNMVDPHHFEMEENGSILRYSIASSQKVTTQIVESKAENKSKPLHYKQLQIKAQAQNWCLVTLFDPWDKRPSVKLSDDNIVTIDCAGKTDTWTIILPEDMEIPSRITGKRNGSVLISCDEKDLAPRH
ncbi:MAG: heparinase II/III family protein [Planctomycetes bacterium]|nr:heparinase II/III family protein [Planctomycetota bacterium]